MKTSLFIIILLAQVATAYGNKTDSVFSQLDAAIRNKQLYARQKEQRIAGLRKTLSGYLTNRQAYYYHTALSKEFRKYKVDSAIYYAKASLAIATALHDNQLQAAAEIQQPVLIIRHVPRIRDHS